MRWVTNMPIVYTNEQNYEDIADAIRAKNGLETLYKPSEMAGAIRALAVTGESLTFQNKIVTPNTSVQEIIADSGYTGLEKVTVNPIPGNYLIPTGSITITENGTTNVAQYASAVVNVPTGSTINNQNKTITPTKSQQSVSADSGYTGLGTVTINAIPPQYITTDDVDAVAGDILNNKTAYVDGVKLTGSMANNGATGGTITAQGGTYTIPAGYTSGGTVTANITASTITNTALNVASFVEDSTTHDYGVRASITIPEGYYTETSLTKDLSTVLPAPETAAAAAQMLSGYQAYTNAGILLTGTMTNNAAWSQTLNQTTTSVTIPAGYHNGTGTVSHVTVDIPNPTISISSSGLITASGSWTRGFTTDNSYSNTEQLTTQAAKTVTPTESEQTAVAAGVYTTGIVKVGAISSTYVGSGITQNDSDDLTVSGATVIVPAGYYATAVSKSVASGNAGTPTATKGTVSSHSISVTPSVTNTTGYISGGTKTGTAVTISASELVSGTKSITTNGTGIDVTNYASVDVSVAGATYEDGDLIAYGIISNSLVSASIVDQAIIES